MVTQERKRHSLIGYEAIKVTLRTPTPSLSQTITSTQDHQNISLRLRDDVFLWNVIDDNQTAVYTEYCSCSTW